MDKKRSTDDGGNDTDWDFGGGDEGTSQGVAGDEEAAAGEKGSGQDDAVIEA